MHRDVVIVGSGPVGLFAAISARRRGLDVVVLDKRRPPLDKACGEGLMPHGAALLRDAGVEVDANGRAPLRGVRYVDGDVVAEASFPGGEGMGVRRTFLSAALRDRAAALGVELRFGVGVRALAPDGVITDAGPVSARYVVGADGLHSTVRALAGLDLGVGPERRFGVRRHYRLPPWSDKVEVHWADDCEAYVTPAGPDRVGVAFLFGDKGRFGDLLHRFPALEERVSHAPFDSDARGAGPFHQRVAGVVAGHVALVGDAAGYLDAITGEGLALGFREGVVLAEALAADDLSAYARAVPRIQRLPYTTLRAMLAIRRRPALRSALIRAFARSPVLLSWLLGVNDGQLVAPWRLPRSAIAGPVDG